MAVVGEGLKVVHGFVPVLVHFALVGLEVVDHPGVESRRGVDPPVLLPSRLRQTQQYQREQNRPHHFQDMSAEDNEHFEAVLGDYVQVLTLDLGKLLSFAPKRRTNGFSACV